MEPMETMYSPAYLPGRQFSHGSSSAIYESPLDLSINTVQQASSVMIPDPENISLPHGGRFLGQPGSSSSAFSQAYLMYPNMNVSNDPPFQQAINFDVHSSRRMPVLFPYGHPPASLSVSQNQGIVFNQNSYVQCMPSSLGITNHRIGIHVNGQHMSNWTAKRDTFVEDQGARNRPKNLKGCQSNPVTFNSPLNSHSLSCSDASANNILNTSQVYNTNRLSPLILPSAVAPSPLPHIRKKEGADGNQKDSPRTARDFPDQPGQTVAFPRTSCTTTNIEGNSTALNGGDIGLMKALDSSQHGSHIYVAKDSSNNVVGDAVSNSILSSSQMMPSFKRTREGYLKEELNSGQSFSHAVGIPENTDTNSITTMPRLKAVSPSGHRSSTENSTSPLGPPPLIAAIDSSGSTRLQEQNVDVPKLLPQVFQWHDPVGKPGCSNSTAMPVQSKCGTPVSESNYSTTMSSFEQQAEHLSVILQLPNSARNAASPKQEYRRQKPHIVSLTQSSLFCTEQKFNTPVPIDNTINNHHTSCDVALFSPQVHPVWNISSGEDLNISKSFASESTGISTVQIDGPPYFHRIKAENCVSIGREIAGASELEDLKPSKMEDTGPSVFHSQQAEMFHTTTVCNGQDKKKSDPIMLENTEISNSFFDNLDFENFSFFPSGENGRSPVMMHNSELSDFDDQTHLISSLKCKNANRGNDAVTYAEIHPIPKEFLGSLTSVSTDSTGSTDEQNISCIQPRSDSHLLEPCINEESIQVGLNGIFNAGYIDNEISMPLNNEKYLVSSVTRKSVTSLVGEKPSTRKLTSSSEATEPSARKMTAWSDEIKTRFLIRKKENVLCERVGEHKVPIVVSDHIDKSDPGDLTLCGLKRKLSDLNISASSTSHSQPKRPKDCMKTCSGHITEKCSSHKVENVLSEQSQLHFEDSTIQIQGSSDKAVDVSLDCERTRRTTFIDFKPEVLESRTRHQQNIQSPLQRRRGKRRSVGSETSKGCGTKESPVKLVAKIKLQRSPKKQPHISPSIESVSDNPHSAISTDICSKIDCENSIPNEIHQEASPCSSACDSSQRSETCQNNSPSESHLDTSKPQEEKPKNMFRHQTIRRRRLKSGLDMIRKKKTSIKKKLFQSPVPKEQKEKKKPELLDLKKLVVNKSLGESPLHRAARQGNLELVQLCIRSSYCGVNSSDNAGYMPLHEACSKGNLEVARVLLENGADVNACATGGVRPIHDAVENDHVELTRLLLSYGADPTISTYSGRTIGSFVKSQIMSDFLRGFFTDVGVHYDGNLLALPSTSSSNWSFAGSAACLDPALSGYDVCGTYSIDAESPNVDDPGFLFEMSESDIIPTFLFSLYLNDELQKFVLLYDVLNHLGITEVEFAMKYPDVNVISVPLKDFRDRASCCQILVNPDVSQNSYKVQIILYSEQIRSILGIEAMYIVL